MYVKFVKPVLDVVLSLIGMLVLLPVFVFIAVVLAVIYKGQVFFKQERPGYQCRAFYVYKFKTMTDETDSHGNLLPNHKRTTKIGKFLRKTSLDEIPQLINVIKGEMSLVGPRPLLFRYVPLYSKEQMRRHDVKPGITGWAQVNGRNAISWTDKFKLDVYYADNISFLLDMKIIFLTVIKVLKGSDVNKSETVTAEPFNGNN